MRLLFYRYGSICEPFLISAFEELGVHITELTYEIVNKNMKPSEIVMHVNHALTSSNYDFVFSVNFFPVVSDVCNIFQIPYIGWSVDSPVLELFSRSVTNACNYLFLFDRRQYEEVAPLNPGHIFYLPLATDPAYMTSVIHNDPPSSNPAFTSDISFVGSLYTEKSGYDTLIDPPAYLSGYLDGLIESQLLVYGYYFIDELLSETITNDFKKHLPDYYVPPDTPFLTDQMIISQFYLGKKISALERVRLIRLLATQLGTQYSLDIYTGSDTSDIAGLNHRGHAKTLTEMPLIFHNSVINLNITARSIRSGIPLRVWDIMGCGGFVLTNYQPELLEYFIPGEHLDIYEDTTNLIEKCRYYMEHRKQAREIAENALSLIQSQHTYLHRLEILLQIILKHGKETI